MSSRFKARKKTLDQQARKLSRVHAALIAAGVALLGVFAWGWWAYERDGSAFQQLVRQGNAALRQVQTFPSEGQEHVPQGTGLRFRTNPPTSGAHYPRPTDVGFYDAPQDPGNLVHALEHGIVVIYYDRPTEDARQLLRTWTAQFTDPWAGVIATPKPGIGAEIILTAWTKMLRLERFDAAAAAAFIDQYRGRGPERPVR